MKLKIIIIAMLAVNAKAELFTLIGHGATNSPSTKTINVSSNQIFSVNYYDTTYYASDYHYKADTDIVISNSSGAFFLDSWYQQPVTNCLSGPITISMTTSNRYILTYSITDKYPATISSTSVVIPSDVSGLVNIVMESSPDLINWTPSLPGAYGNNGTNRFFRVRATQ